MTYDSYQLNQRGQNDAEQTFVTAASILRYRWHWRSLRLRSLHRSSTAVSRTWTCSITSTQHEYCICEKKNIVSLGTILSNRLYTNEHMLQKLLIKRVIHSICSHLLWRVLCMHIVPVHEYCKCTVQYKLTF